jgi:hypothetical protein
VSISELLYFVLGRSHHNPCPQNFSSRNMQGSIAAGNNDQSQPNSRTLTRAKRSYAMSCAL